MRKNFKAEFHQNTTSVSYYEFKYRSGNMKECDDVGTDLVISGSKTSKLNQMKFNGSASLLILF